MNKFILEFPFLISFRIELCGRLARGLPFQSIVESLSEITITSFSHFTSENFELLVIPSKSIANFEVKTFASTKVSIQQKLHQN